MMIFAIDFDGTCVTHDFPDIGADIGAVPVMRDIVAAGHDIILWTMRSGETLAQACKWFEQQGIPLFGVNQNPQQSTWSSSPKAYAHRYIDDAAHGCPLVYPINGRRPYVNWDVVRANLIAEGVLAASEASQ